MKGGKVPFNPGSPDKHEGFQRNDEGFCAYPISKNALMSF